jgi:hypothetical protein
MHRDLRGLSSSWNANKSNPPPRIHPLMQHPDHLNGIRVFSKINNMPSAGHSTASGQNIRGAAGDCGAIR